MAKYYVDFTNGSDAKNGTSDPADIASPHSAEASTDATHVYVTDGTLTDGDADDFFNGDFLFNVTRDAGALITDYDADDGSGNSVVTHGNITNQVSTDTFYILKSWQTISKAGTTLTAGDTAYARGADTDTYAADINFTNDGTMAAPITIQGCYDGVTDPWGDGVVARPIVDFNSGTYHFIISSDNYWVLEGLKITGSTYTGGAIYCNASYGVRIVDCEISGNNSVGIRLLSSINSQLIDCILYDNGTDNVQVRNGNYLFSGCKIYGGGGGTTIGLNFSSSLATCHLVDTLLGNSGGGTSEHSTADIRGYWGFRVYGRNVLLDSTTQVLFPAYNVGGFVSIEDDGQVFGAYSKWQTLGKIIKDTGETPPGGSGWAFKAVPLADVSAIYPLYLVGNDFEGFPVYLDGTEQTITVKMKCLAADWSEGAGTDNRPDNSELYIEVEHHNAATTLLSSPSSEACSDDTYTSFTVTLTPSAAGKATVRPKLEIYDLSAPVYIDPVVLVT